jgi:hypothetical protein
MERRCVTAVPTPIEVMASIPRLTATHSESALIEPDWEGTAVLAFSHLPRSRDLFLNCSLRTRSCDTRSAFHVNN